MSEKKANVGAGEEQESILDMVQDALVGTHEEVPPADPAENDDRPPLKSP